MQAAALAAAPFISTSVARARWRPPRKKKLGFALCGLGGLGSGQIAPALQKTENCRLAGIITGNAGGSRQVEGAIQHSGPQHLQLRHHASHRR
jgi:hypothetical protein